MSASHCLRFIILLTVTCISFGKRTEQKTDIAVCLNPISENVCTFHIDAPQHTNVIVIRSAKGLVVIDTETSPVFTSAIRDRIRNAFPSDPFYCLINTHEHGDHTYGNQVYSDVPVIAQEHARNAMLVAEQKRQETVSKLGTVVAMLSRKLDALPADNPTHDAVKQKLDYYRAVQSGLGEGFQLTLPSIVFSDRLNLDLGNLTLELTWYGKSHSDSDIIIECPQEHIILTGDLFASGMEPYIDSERIQHMDRWIRLLKHATDRNGELKAIIPAHGDLLTMQDLTDTLKFVQNQQTLYKGKDSSFLYFKEILNQNGMEPALLALRTCFSNPDKYYTLHPEIDSFAFHLMMEGNVDEALKIFHVLAELFPEKDMAFDSLGEAYLRKQEPETARKYFQQAVNLNPDNGNAAARLASLGD